MKKSFKKYFIPNAENDHKPHFLREKSVLIIATLALVLLLASIVGSYVIKNSKFLASIQSAFLVDLTNQDRLVEGADKLVINEKLTRAAQLKANDMAEKGYFAHTSPEGLTPWYWFGKAEYNYIYAGENLAVNFSRSEDLQNAWMNSPLHRANILNNRYKEVGIATAEGVYKGKNTTFVVQMFGTPSSLTINTPDQNQEASVLTTLVVETQPSLVALNTLTPEALGETSVNIEEENIQKIEEMQEVTSEDFKYETVSVANEKSEPENIFTETVNGDYESQTALGSEDSIEEVVYTNWFERFLINPGEIVNKAYVILFVIILFSLILKIFIAINKQHPKNIAYGVLLLILVLIFMYLNQSMFSDPVVTTI